jgi:hypothetical protein
MSEKDEAWKRLVQICKGTSSTKELLTDLRSGPADSKGWPFFQGAVRFATSEDFADLGEERGPVENAIERLASAGDERAIKLWAQVAGQDSSAFPPLAERAMRRP